MSLRNVHKVIKIRTMDFTLPPGVNKQRNHFLNLRLDAILYPRPVTSLHVVSSNIVKGLL